MVGQIIQKRNGTGYYNKTGDSTSSSSSFASTIITPNAFRPETDVLCGRNKAALSSLGNRTFRVSLALYIPRYEAACTKLQKSAVILYVCNVFRYDVGVRFLKKYQDKDNTYYYLELNEKEIKKKVGHALRDMSVARRQVLNEKQRLGVLTKTKTKPKTTTATTSTATTATAIATTVPNTTSTTTTTVRPTKQISQRDDDNNPSTTNPISIHNEEGRTKLLKLITFDDDNIVDNDEEEEHTSSVLNRSGRRDDLGESLQEFLPYVEYDDYCNIPNTTYKNNNNINNLEDMELLEPIPIHETTTTLLPSSSTTTHQLPASTLYLQQQQHQSPDSPVTSSSNKRVLFNIHEITQEQELLRGISCISPTDSHHYDQTSSSVVAGDMVRLMTMVEEEDTHPDTVTSNSNNKRQRIFNIHEITQEQELLRGISCI
eukprot:CAMPEP_0170996684 /NCGR_PEP_ID=MMETSP0736-20130129/12386_1 /TAXON_ID=186038 /ORGANISM="Fragilariopsis kerguelensis, Strain L26-C5" /LENGTH=429 /DNA_ID=CAMNT_0011423181 /DNA_START=70 /DNA_END=1359 /DNA_ORIENTATION=+